MTNDGVVCLGVLALIGFIAFCEMVKVVIKQWRKKKYDS